MLYSYTFKSLDLPDTVLMFKVDSNNPLVENFVTSTLPEQDKKILVYLPYMDLVNQCLKIISNDIFQVLSFKQQETYHILSFEELKTYLKSTSNENLKYIDGSHGISLSIVTCKYF